MKYKSTRGGVSGLSFEDAVFMGLAPDKGLLVPESMPEIPRDFLSKWKDLSYQELAIKILSLFIDDSEIPAGDLRNLVSESYSRFRDRQIVPVKKVGDVHIAELFHGPTFAFKDIALQFLGNLFPYFLSRPSSTREAITILGATSGDTGSSAIEGLRGKENVKVFILYPHGRISEIQERQMTSVMDSNIHAIAIEGSFDDAQKAVKDIFGDADFKSKFHLGAVNSINWARILAQIVYYFYAYFRVVEAEGLQEGSKVVFSVPTGNFGDILAGYYAKCLGLPVAKLIVATNENDILHRFFQTGSYTKSNLVPTVSPSMDIVVSSNFERYLYSVSSENAQLLNAWMDNFENSGSIAVAAGIWDRAKDHMASASIDRQTTIATIQKYFKQHGTILDPHSAIGVAAAEMVREKGGSEPSKTIPYVCLCTAAFDKFGDTVKEAIGSDKMPSIHPNLSSLLDAPTRSTKLPYDMGAIKEFISTHS